MNLRIPRAPRTPRTLVLLGAILLASLVFAPFGEGSSATQAESWEKIDESDGISVYRREVAGSALLAFRGEGRIDAPLQKVASIILDYKRAPEWVVDLEESKIVEWLNPTDFVEYDHIGTPVVMKDRDFLSIVHMDLRPEKRELTFQYKPFPDQARVVSNYVRGDLLSSRFVLRATDDGQKTWIEGEIHCDPKGAVAKWIVNFFQKSWPVATFKALRQQAAKKDIALDSRFDRLK